MRENIRDVGRDLNMARGKSTLRGGTLREVGSANRSELEARPNGDQKGKERVYRGLLEMAEHGRNATNRRSGNCISEKGNARKTPNCFGDRYMGQSAAANCGGERGLASAAAKKQTDATWPLNSRLWLSANVSLKSRTNWTATLARR
jgi:hypothetical protein